MDLGQEIRIDEIVLAPTLSRDTKEGFQADGFPLEFRIIAGSTGDKQGSVVASFSEQDGLLPRIAPLVVPCVGTTASWVRIEASRLSPRGIDGSFTLQLSELLVFSGSKNCALRRPVTCPAPDPYPISPWGERYLTDGSVPYLMDAAQGDNSKAYINMIRAANHPALTIDLEGIYSISQINLHAIEQSDTVPQATNGDVGIPKHLQIEGALQPDFSESVLLLEARCKTIYDMAPIMIWNVPATPCRFVRLTALEPYIDDNGINAGSRIGFAEIELFEEDHNVALAKPTSTNFKMKLGDRDLSTLTDGLNFYGNILPIREWMHQLARRHDLEKERPRVAAELNKRYARQKSDLLIMYWLAALLAAGIVVTVLIDRIVRLRYVARIKERFAADLHDELGANIHSIGMLSDIAQDADSQEEWELLHQRIWELTKRTSTAIRHCTNMLEANGLYIGLVEDMQRAAQRITVNCKHDIAIEGEPYLNRLKPRTRVDLFLFYKECLVNICRHSGATQLSTRLVATAKNLSLIVRDDGKGLTGSLEGKIPSSLQRRARLLRAKIIVESPAAGGTCINLELRTRRWGRFL